MLRLTGVFGSLALAGTVTGTQVGTGTGSLRQLSASGIVRLEVLVNKSAPNAPNLKR